MRNEVLTIRMKPRRNNRTGLAGVSVGELCSRIAEPPGLSFI
jgi:hypothetical protein